MIFQSRFYRWGHKALMALCGVALVPAALAWTDKPVKMLVPAPAGGNIDVIARLVADQLGSDLGQPVVVENRPGAGGAIGVQALRAAPADGQTVMMIASNVLTEIPHVLKGGFDPLKDVKPVGIVGRGNLVMIAALPRISRALWPMPRRTRAIWALPLTAPAPFRTTPA